MLPIRSTNYQKYLMLFNLWCKNVALAIKEKTHSAKHRQVVWIFMIPNFTGSPLYEEFFGIICHSSLYFATLTYIYELWTMNYGVLQWHCALCVPWNVSAVSSFYVSRISDWTAMSLFMNVSVLCMPKSISTYEYHTKKTEIHAILTFIIRSG